MDYIEKLKTIEARTWEEYLANLQSSGRTEKEAEDWLESTLAYVQEYATSVEDLEALREQYAECLSGTSDPDDLGDSATCAEYALTIALIDIIADGLKG